MLCLPLPLLTHLRRHRLSRRLLSVSWCNFTYTVGVNNIGTAELPQNVYTLNGVDGPGIAGSVGDSFYFDFSAVAVATRWLSLLMQARLLQLLWVFTPKATL